MLAKLNAIGGPVGKKSGIPCCEKSPLISAQIVQATNVMAWILILLVPYSMAEISYAGGARSGSAQVAADGGFMHTWFCVTQLPGWLCCDVVTGPDSFPARAAVARHPWPARSTAPRPRTGGLRPSPCTARVQRVVATMPVDDPFRANHTR